MLNPSSHNHHSSAAEYNTEREEKYLSLIENLDSFSFQQGFLKWESLIADSLDSPRIGQYLDNFLKRYPFSAKYWIILANWSLRNKGKPECLKIYQVSLFKNPKCLTLWVSYLNWLRKELFKSDPDFLKKETQRAVSVVGHHPDAHIVFQHYFDLEKDPVKTFATIKKMLAIPLRELDLLWSDASKWITQMTNEELYYCARAERIMEADELKIKSIMKESAKKIYDQTKQEWKARAPFQDDLVLEEYRPFNGKLTKWKEYIQFLKNANRIEELPTVYERALLSQCDSESLWEEYFLFLEYRLGNTTRIIDLFRNHDVFFTNLSVQLWFQWIQFEEKELPNKARELYIDMEKKKCLAESFFRHIQLQIRAKEYSNARIIYDTMLTVFASNCQLIGFIVVEYSDFMIKYFRDVEFSKRMIKTYFEYYPFIQYLYLYYLEFYIKHIELKDNNKELFEEYLNIVLFGLAKAHRALDETQYKNLKKNVGNLMRNYLTSIYFIKTAERKIKEQEIVLQAGVEVISDFKRPAESKLDHLDVVSKKKKTSTGAVSFSFPMPTAQF